MAYPHQPGAALAGRVYLTVQDAEGPDVKPGPRFIEQNQFRFEQQKPRKVQALGHTPREAARPFVCETLEFHAVERVQQPSFVSGEVVQRTPEREVLQRGQVGINEGLVAEIAQLLVRDGTFHGARARARQSGHDLKQGRLARTVGTGKQRHRTLFDGNNRLQGLITMKDIDKVVKYPNACKDENGRLRVGAAIGIGRDCEERASELIAAGVDVLVLDSAHGHSRNVLRAIEMVKTSFPQCQLIAGNVATYEGAKAILKAGADAVKVGIGPGSICTTRIVAGVGVPQVTAIMEAVKAANEMDRCLIADGGIKFSGDVVKALCVGAHTVMIGSLFAGTDESPGETILYQGRTYKIYRGMGSIDAMKDGSSDRYFQEKSKKLVPEGIVGRVPVKGPVADSLYQLIGGLRAGMGYVGAANMEELREKSRFVEISAAGLRESHVHDVIITKEAPNYRVEN